MNRSENSDRSFDQSVSEQIYTVVPSAPNSIPEGKREHFG